MEDELCFIFYTLLCCSLCCPPLQKPLNSRAPQGSQSESGSKESTDVIVDNPSSPPINGVNKPLKKEQHLK